MEWKRVFRLPFWTVGVGCRFAVKRREGYKVVGVTNKVGHYYVPFFDYDMKELKFLVPEIRSLQEEFLLGNAYLFRTGDGYHIIMLDLLTGQEWKELLNASNCDEDYKSVPSTNKVKAWVLRLSAKGRNTIRYEGVVIGQGVGAISAPHREMLLRRGVPEKDLPQTATVQYEGERLIYAAYEA